MKYLTGKNKQRFEAIQGCLSPKSRQFTDEQKLTSLKTIDDILSTKEAKIRFQFFTFLRVIDCISLILGFHTFKKLSDQKQKRVMQFFFDSPIGLLRKGFWGLNTLAKMGVYGQESVYKEIGYELRETPHA